MAGFVVQSSLLPFLEVAVTIAGTHDSYPWTGGLAEIN